MALLTTAFRNTGVDDTATDYQAWADDNSPNNQTRRNHDHYRDDNYDNRSVYNKTDYSSNHETRSNTNDDHFND